MFHFSMRRKKKKKKRKKMSSSLVEIDAPSQTNPTSVANRVAPTEQSESDHSNMPPPSYDALDPRPLQALVDARANTAVFAATNGVPGVVAKSVASNAAISSAPSSAASSASSAAVVMTAEWAKVHANVSELSQSMRALEERVVRSNAASEKRLEAFQRQLDDLPDLIATRVESALKAELKRQQALDALNKTSSSSSSALAAPTGLPMAASSAAAAAANSNNKPPVQYSRLPGASLSEGASVPDEDDFAPPVAFAQWKPSLQAPGAVEAPVQQQPPVQQVPFQLPQQQQQSLQPQFHQPQQPLVLQPQSYAPQQQQQSYSAPQPYPVYQQQQPQKQQQQPVYQPAPAPVATYVAQPTLTFPETSNYATYSASGFDTSPSVLYPVSSSAPQSSSNRAPEVDQRAKQEADDAALAARLQREMNDEGSSASAAASQRSSSMPTTTSYMPTAASPSYSYMTAPPPASMMPQNTSSAAAAAGPSTATRQCPVCQINVASDMLELHVNEHFEALDEPVPQGNYGMPVSSTGTDGTAKPAPRRGLMARLFGGPENKPAEVQQGRPPSNGYPGSVVAQPTPQYTNTNVAYARVAQQYYPQSYPSSNPGNN
jgi:hypothetical protein